MHILMKLVIFQLAILVYNQYPGSIWLLVHKFFQPATLTSNDLVFRVVRVRARTWPNRAPRIGVRQVAPVIPGLSHLSMATGWDFFFAWILSTKFRAQNI